MRHAVAFFFMGAITATALLSTAGEQVPEATPEEALLRSAGLATDGNALLEFFRERTQPTADLDKLLALARQLGDANTQTKARAAAKLVAAGPWAVPALRHVINELDNPLATQQARRCLEWVEGPRSKEVPIAAAKLLATRKPAGAAAILLAYLPRADDQTVLDAVKAALVSLAASPGAVDAALLAALQDPLPLRRSIAVEVLAGSGHPEILPEVQKLLADPKPQVRLRVALALADQGDEKAIGVLIDLLADLPIEERREAEHTLQQFAGEWSPNPVMSGDDELSRKIRREAWAGWWRTMDGPALLAAFRQRTLSKEDLAKAQILIEQLGDKSLDNRERAVSELLATGPKVLGLLREATKSTEPERARRAEICLKQITQSEEKEKLPLAAPLLLAVRKPAGATEALLAYLPFTDDNSMKDKIGKALKILVMTNGQPDPAVLQALSDPLPVRRIAAAEALVGAGGAGHPAIRKLLTDANQETRLRVVMALVHAHDKEAMLALIDLVAELPREQTREAEEFLRGLAGAKAPALPTSDDATARKKYRENWLAWWKENSATTNLAEPERKTPAAPSLLVVAELAPKAAKAKENVFGAPGGPAGKKGAALPLPVNPVAGTDRLVAVDRSGHAHWQIENLQHPIDFQILPGDRVLIAEYSGNRITERDLTGKILWEVKVARPPVSTQRLANGNTFIALYNTPATGGGTMVEIDKAGKTVATFANPLGAAAAKKGPILRAGYKAVDGQMICMQSKGICVRLDGTGKEIKRFALPSLGGASAVIAQVPNFAGNIDVTSKGHLVVMLDNNTVAEYDPEGKIVWKANAVGNRATRLPNGNTLVASESTGVVELDSAGKTVWHYQPPAGYQTVRARPASDVITAPRPIVAPAPANAAFGGIDPKVVAAWEKAGAKFGWQTSGSIGFSPTPTAPDVLPGFQFGPPPRQGAILELPAPNVSFVLDSRNFADGQLKEVASLKHLRVLMIWNSAKVTDAGVKELAPLTPLQGLNLGGTNVTDVGLKELAGLTQLKYLQLWNTPITDASLKVVAGMRQMQHLNIRQTNVTDAGVKSLAGLQQLQTLWLDSTQVTDAGLRDLAAFKLLQELHITVDQTRVTNAGVAALQKALPNLKITFEAAKKAKAK